MAGLISIEHSSGVIGQINQIENFTRINSQLNQFIQITNEVKDSTDKVESGFSKLRKSLISLGEAAASGIYTALKDIGTASWDASNIAEKSLNIMKVGTGATGAELKGLMASYQNLGSSVPDNLNAVATVMAQVHKSTGAAGVNLEEMSGKIMRLGSLTGVSTNTIATSLSGVMNGWSISADQGSEMFDKLYVLSQKSGVGINVLADKLNKFGAPMRQLGYDFDNSASLMATWASNGLDADMVLGSFSTALGKMAAQDIKDPGKGLQSTIAQIKEAKTTAEASQIAMKAFGDLSGPSMAQAIREGKLELGTMLQEMQNSQGIINSTSKETETLANKFDTFKNKISIALAPLGDKLKDLAEKSLPTIERVFNDLSKSLTEAMPAIDTFANGIGDVLGKTLDGVVASIDFFVKHIDILGPPIAVFSVFVGVGLASALWSLAAAQWAALSPLLLFIAAGLILAGIIAYWIFIFKNWGNITSWLGEKWEQFKNMMFGVFNEIGSFISTYWPYVLNLILLPIIYVSDLISFCWNKIVSETIIIFQSIVSSLVTIMDGLMLFFTGAMDKFQMIFTEAFNSILAYWDSIGDLVMTIGTTVSDFFSMLFLDLQTGVKTIMDMISTEIDLAINWLLLLPERMKTLGSNIIQGLISGINETIGNVTDIIKNVANSISGGIRDFLGIHSPSRVMMEVGFMTTEGLALGLEDGQARVAGSSEKVAEGIRIPYDDIALNGDLNFPDASPTSFSSAMPANVFSFNNQGSPTNTASTEINPVINITVNGDGSGANAQDIAERVKLAIQEVFESAARRQGIAGVQSWQL
ncbi:phage tail tape measure protein [Paenibacillus periandrae]|uniref:phage tail tape measure protein n=1 Tax=Paenibacillus periandrae TaxID=1761741 RepID=UPI001F08DB2B|nr:phage tail tape measure protein [Paenibacillus periandrae]